MMADEFEKCADHPIVEAGSYSLVEWGPDPEGKEPATQVHLLLSLESVMPGAAMVLRLKSRRACQELIDILTKQRDSVWPVH